MLRHVTQRRCQLRSMPSRGATQSDQLFTDRGQHVAIDLENDTSALAHCAARAEGRGPHGRAGCSVG